MKKILLVTLLVLFSALMHMSAEDVKVTMKNGTVFTGVLKEFDPTDHVTVIVAGIETTIPISDVASVEKPNAQQVVTVQQQTGDDTKLQYGKYTITDTKDYPESFTLKIGDQELTMILVRGGWFNMGYDGRHSISWETEPVHRVTLSSFYVSKQLLNHNVAAILLKDKKISKTTKYEIKEKKLSKNGDKNFPFYQKKEVDSALVELCNITNEQYRLLTEAEWEYISLMPFAELIFGSKSFKDEWCSDIWGKYRSEDQVNPQGAFSGKNYVVRHFSLDNEKWKRKKENSGLRIYARIAISADQINIK